MIVAIALLPILAQVKGMLGDVRGQLPELLNLGKATLGNVKVMSDDVKGTTHQGDQRRESRAASRDFDCRDDWNLPS